VRIENERTFILRQLGPDDKSETDPESSKNPEFDGGFFSAKEHAEKNGFTKSESDSLRACPKTGV
jgi:hypothetical protein